ncbi:hypothetical protein F5877DRAFT_86479 [Lentinula edodes]|nr:hypothetical protein F5877DRAFT_86479 [Lentinula edodes]
MDFSLLSVSLSQFLSTLVCCLYDHLYDPIYAFTSRLSNPSESPSSPTPNALFWDLDLGNVEATPYIELRAASPLQPPTLKDVHL